VGRGFWGKTNQSSNPDRREKKSDKKGVKGVGEPRKKKTVATALKSKRKRGVPWWITGTGPGTQLGRGKTTARGGSRGTDLKLRKKKTFPLR